MEYLTDRLVKDNYPVNRIDGMLPAEENANDSASATTGDE